MRGKGLLLIAIFVIIISALFYYYRTAKSVPNIVLITIDTLRADHLGCYGYGRKISPSLDRLAAQGLLFENAFCVMPSTIPSHGSIFFGTWPRVHGSTGNHYKFTNQSLSFFPQLLQKAGYSTAAFISRDHLTRAIKRVPGFQTVMGAKPFEDKRAETTFTQALDWLRGAKPRQFFIWIHLWEPHQPYDIHPQFLKSIAPGFKLDFERRHSFFPKDSYNRESLRKMVDLYDNEVSYVDHQLGLFLENMEKNSYLDNTMIVVTSDHGETLDELVTSQGYGFDHGEFLYDPQLRVPLLVVSPGMKKAGQRVSQVVTLLDLMPTFLQSVGLPVPDTVQGNSLLPFLEGKQPETPPQMVFLHRGKYKERLQPFLLEEQFGVRERTYKLIYTGDSKTWTLYRNGVEEAPVLDHQEAKIALQQKLQMWMDLTRRLASPTQEKVSEEEIEQLRSLGYVQ